MINLPVNNNDRVLGFLVVAAAILFHTGCSGGIASAHAEPEVRDSAGVTIIEHPADLPPRREWVVQLDEALRLSGDFFQVRGAIRLEGGRIVVADGGSHSLRLFEADGSLGGSVGRAGGGPGEFRDISFMGRWPADSIVVWDVQLRRLSVLDGTGTLARTFAPEVTGEVPFASIRGVYSDGSMLATGFAQMPGGVPPQGRQRIHSPAYFFRSDGRLASVLPFTASSEGYYEVFADGGFRVFPPLFALSTVLYAGPDVLVYASNDRFELRVYTPSGEPLRYIRRTGQTARITGDLRRTGIEGVLASMASGANRDERRRALEAMEIPDNVPAFGRVHVDRANHLWVEEYTPKPSENSVWLVFAADGSFISRARVPHSLVPLEIGDDYFLGVHRDEMGIENVILAKLGR